MRTLKLSALVSLLVAAFLVSGCNEELKSLRVQNDAQAQKIDQLRAELQAKELELTQLKNRLDTMEEKGGVEAETLRAQIAALEEDLDKKRNLISSMQQQLMTMGGQLPAELSTMIEEFAQAHPDMVSFDTERGLVKFKSDLLFEKGSDKVTPDAVEAVKSLCTILNSEQGEEFDAIIAGHTDNIPILKPDTKAKHPTNWHLSAHRAISVLNVMMSADVDPERLSVRGFGEYRPIEPNKPANKGNPQNRRVEIYIVPKGM